MRKLLYTIVLNYNNYIDTRQCIESLQKSLYPVEKIVLVDNASSDGSLERFYADYLQDNKVYIIKNEYNLGFARGANVGIQFALDLGADFIFLLNNDAIIDQECIKKLCAAMEEDERVGLAGPRIFYYCDPEKIWQGGGYFSLWKTGIVSPEKNKLVINSSEKAKEVTFLTGCAMLVKRQVFEKIGLFDEDFFFYGEDVDFCLRARRAGFKLIYVPEAKAWHKIEDIARNRTSPFVMYHLSRSHLLVLRKNFPGLYYLYGVIVHFLLYTPYRMWQIMRGSRSWEAVSAWFEGTLDGMGRMKSRK
ncbi:MAG: glycosyltransferase family 2 protein [Candidatus Methanomethylicaceae archaeon]